MTCQPKQSSWLWVQLQLLAALPLTAGLGKTFTIVRGWDSQCCQHFWRCFPIQQLPLARAGFSDFPMTNLCLSGHLTLETDCNGNTFTGTISCIFPKSKTSIIHMISVPSSAFSIFLPSSSHTALEHGPESPFP